MALSSPPYLPLIRFFDAWRTQGAELGMEEYFAFLDALKGGYGYGASGENLFSLCKYLWFNPGDSIVQFKTLFSEFWELEKTELQDLEETGKPFGATGKGETQDPRNSRPFQRRRTSKEARPQTAQHTLLDVDEKDAERINLREDFTPYYPEGYAPSSGQTPRIKLADFSELPQIDPQIKKDTHRESIGESLEQQFKFVPQPFPPNSNPRLIRLAIRHLFQAEGFIPTRKPDVEKTLDNMIREGDKLKEVVFQQKPAFTARLNVLIDTGPDMAAYKRLTELFLELIQHELHEPPQVWYFSEIIGPVLYRNKAHTESVHVFDLAKKRVSMKYPLMIIGEAGAAKGKYDRDVILNLYEGVARLRKIANKIVWINPLPKSRWSLPSPTNAEQIHKFIVPMYPFSVKGIQDAVYKLKS